MSQLVLYNLPFPTIIETLEYETIVQRKLSKVKEILKDKGVEYKESEADDLMTLIEADAYEEMFLRAALNERIKEQFLAYASGSNLDHIGVTRFGVERLQGAKPKAEFEFSLSEAKDVDIVLPKALMLGNAEHTAELIEDVVIDAGSLKANGVVELDEYRESSEIKTEDILTPLPWVVKAKQLENFIGGATVEDDERYRERIWLSRERKTTAGSKMQYIFYAKSADVRVQEVDVKNGGAGVVKVYLLAKDFSTDSSIKEAVESALNKEEIRPLTDRPVVEFATVVDVNIDATLRVKNLSIVDLEVVKERFKKYAGSFESFLSVAKVYDLLSDENVADVELRSPTNSITLNEGEVMRFDFNLEVEAI